MGPFGMDKMAGSPSMVYFKTTSSSVTHTNAPGTSEDFLCLPNTPPTDATAMKMLCRIRKKSSFKWIQQGMLALRFMSDEAEARCNGGPWYKMSSSVGTQVNLIGYAMNKLTGGNKRNIGGGKKPCMLKSKTGSQGYKTKEYFMIPCL